MQGEDFPTRFIAWIKRLLFSHRTGTVFVFSDTHFNHKKIIRYCNRPFSGVTAMNEALIGNWNRVVSENDEVWFLGDFVFHGSVAGWAGRLNGRIRFIRGNHDHRLRFARKRKVLRYKGFTFLLVHDPAHIPRGWNGWTIHGHTHNNRMAEYPFINGRKRRINVSAELVNYAPVRLDDLIALDPGTIDRMETIRGPARRMPVAGSLNRER
jgi:calcineurin-like phosphoesterase family protein